jgi:hypothetical protein
LLGAGRHAVGFIEDDEFLAARGEGYFFLGEAFDAVADDVDACVAVLAFALLREDLGFWFVRTSLVAGVEFENGFLVGIAEELAR